MKKFVSLAMTGVLVLGMAACGSNSTDTTQAPVDTEAKTTEAGNDTQGSAQTQSAASEAAQNDAAELTGTITAAGSSALKPLAGCIDHDRCRRFR